MHQRTLVQVCNPFSSFAFLCFHHGNKPFKMYPIEGSLEVKLPTRGPYRKAEVGRVKEEQGRSKKIREEKMSEERRFGRKVANHCVFPMICVSGGSKSRLAKRQVRSHLARGEMKNCTPLGRQPHFQVKM